MRQAYATGRINQVVCAVRDGAGRLPVRAGRPVDDDVGRRWNAAVAVADWQANENIVAGDYGLEPERIGFGDRSVGSEVRFTLPTFFVKNTGHRDYESVCQRTSFKAHQFARRLARQPACTPEQSARSAVIARRADSIPSGGRPRSRTARASRRVDRMGLNLDGKTAIQCSENEKNRQNRGKPVAVPAGWRNRRVSAETDAPTGTPPHSVKSRALLPRVDLATRRE